MRDWDCQTERRCSFLNSAVHLTGAPVDFCLRGETLRQHRLQHEATQSHITLTSWRFKRPAREASGLSFSDHKMFDKHWFSKMEKKIFALWIALNLSQNTSDHLSQDVGSQTDHRGKHRRLSSKCNYRNHTVWFLSMCSLKNRMLVSLCYPQFNPVGKIRSFINMACLLSVLYHVACNHILYSWWCNILADLFLFSWAFLCIFTDLQPTPSLIV